MYPVEIRKFVLVLYNNVKSFRKASLLLGISKSTICRWNKQPERKEYKTRNSKCNNPVIIDIIKGCLHLHRFSTITDIQKFLATNCGLNVSRELLRLVMKHKMNLSFQKPRFYPSPKQSGLKTKEYTNSFDNFFSKKKKHTLVSIDEVGFSSNTRPLKGWNEKATRFHVSFHPSSAEKQHISCCSAMYNGKITYSKIKGHYSTLTFLAFLQEQDFPDHSVLLMDNVRFHHAKIIKEYCNSKNWHILHTPPYSPWFNPIERAFSVIKNHYRKHRSIEQAFKTLDPIKIDKLLLSSYKEVASARSL